jgi:glycosyltransferase involved in cell wall biosynthesis
MRRYFGKAWATELVRNLRVKALELNPWARLAAHRAELVLAANLETRDALRRLGARDVRLMPGSAVMPEWAPRDHPLRVARAAPVVVWVGRLEPRKAPHLAIEAFARAWRTCPAELWMIGDGPLLSSCRALADRLGVSADVHFLGRLSRQDVAERLACADVFLFSSLRDSFAAAPLEAMAYGLPVVALDHQGVRLLPEEAVIKVPISRPTGVVADLSEALVRLIRSEELRRSMGAAGWRHAREKHLWTHRVHDARQMYQDLLMMRRRS